MKKNIRSILYAFNGKLVGTNRMKKYVCEVVSLMEDEAVDFITSRCWFFGSMDDALAFTFTGNDLKDQHLIFLSDELFFHDQRQIKMTIAHEIGHVIMKHRNSVFKKQSKREIKNRRKKPTTFPKDMFRIILPLQDYPILD